MRWRVRIIAGAVGTLLVAGSLTFKLDLAHDVRVSLVPAVLMAVTLLADWTVAAASAAAVSVAALLLHEDPWKISLIAAVAILCAHMLRHGTPPLLVAGVQLMPALLFDFLPLQSSSMALAAFKTLGSAAVNSASNVTLATAALILMPRRCPHLPFRCRVRWHHIVFVLVVGTASVVAVMLLAGTNQPWQTQGGNGTWGEATAARLLLLVIVAFAASFALASRFEAVTHRLPDRLRGPRAHGRLQEMQPRGELQLEVAGFFLEMRRETRRLRRDEARHCKDLTTAHQDIQHLKNELCKTQDALNQRTAQLDKTRRAPDGARARYEAGNMTTALATLEPAGNLTGSAHRWRDLCVATMSHELRTPLHGLIAMLDMLHDGDCGSAESRNWLAIARTSARMLLRIANDILDLTRMDSGHLRLERQPFCLCSILEEIVAEFRARTESSGLSVAMQLPPARPPAFLGDSVRLKQILGNLVSNALRFTSNGGVTLAAQYDGTQCIIDVIDTGEGIPHDMRDSIFDPFVQAASTSARHGGAGLGLPISRRLAEAMGGTLTLLRTDPTGSTFRLTLPLEASDQALPDEQSQRISNYPCGRVLVVEDNSVNRSVAEALLTSLGCTVTIVESGVEALELLGKQQFDLILMDCQMPGLDGFETTRRVRRLPGARVPIIAMTANATTEDRSQCLEVGMDDFLPKPFGRRALNDVLCKWLDPASAERAGRDLAERLASLPALDVRVFDDLRESLQWRREPLQRICTTFVSSAEEILRLLDESAGADRRAPPKHLHTLRGSAGMVGARQVEYLAGKLERAVESNPQEAVPTVTDLLRQAVRRFEREFEARLEAVTPGGYSSQ